MPNTGQAGKRKGGRAALRWLCLAYGLWNVLLYVVFRQPDSFIPFIGGALFESLFWLGACKLALDAQDGKTPQLRDALYLLRGENKLRNFAVVLATLLPLWVLSISSVAENRGAAPAVVAVLRCLAILGMLTWFFPYAALHAPQGTSSDLRAVVWRCLRTNLGDILSLRLRMLLKYLLPFILLCALILALSQQGAFGQALPASRDILAYMSAIFFCLAGPLFLQTEAGCAAKILKESRKTAR